ncbi:hypothetical protein HWI46_08615 [Staphylococcus epidermidis]|uniref:hypothetical protein n=1 Tax=Staphylococcus epidermidis TaxID=1282 RepID=UPI00280B03BD|nr:hypothetical protein [Staphylococcus epidermidis]
MEYKQIYDKSNGKPDLIMYDETQAINYDISKYTEIQPPSDIYEPMHFEHNRWVGTPYEEWKKQQEIVDLEPTEIDEKDTVIAKLSLELLKTQEELNDVRKDISDLTIQILGGTTNA